MSPRKPKPKAKKERPTPRHKLAEGLKALREAAGMSLRELSDKTGWDHTHLHAMEQGRSLGSLAIVVDLDTVYGTEPMVKLMWELARADKGAFREKYQRYMELETSAVAIHVYALDVLHGLLQTEAYARELLSQDVSTDDVDVQVTARLERQTVLTGDDAPQFRAIIDECALRRGPTNPQDRLEQLAHLVRLALLPNVTLQVLPFAVGLHALSNTDMMLLWQPDGTSQAYTETGYSGELFEEPKDVATLRVAYDRVRDLALSPRESVAFIEQLMEDIPCDPPEAT